MVYSPFCFSSFFVRSIFLPKVKLILESISKKVYIVILKLTFLCAEPRQLDDDGVERVRLLISFE